MTGADLGTSMMTMLTVVWTSYLADRRNGGKQAEVRGAGEEEARGGGERLRGRRDLLVASPVVGGVGKDQVVGLETHDKHMALNENPIMGLQSGPSKQQLGKGEWEGSEEATLREGKAEKRGEHAWPWLTLMVFSAPLPSRSMMVLRWPGRWVVLDTKLTVSDTECTIPAVVAGRVLGRTLAIEMCPSGHLSMEPAWMVAVLRKDAVDLSLVGVRSVFMKARGLKLPFYEGRGRDSTKENGRRAKMVKILVTNGGRRERHSVR